MPAHVGPNTLGESNLVFAYDTGDVKNSYKGQPTVNAFGVYPTDLYSWVNGGNQVTLSRDTIPSPVGNTPLKMVCNGNDPYTSTYNSTANNISAASSGQTWTISVWAKANQNTTGQIFHFGANSSGNIIDFSATTISLTTEWTRYTYTRTFTDGNVVAIQARLDGPDTFQSGVVIWWDGLQVEQKAYATQFTTGTRSVTQGLLPLVENTTFNLTNMSFTSNAQMTFDGTDDYISCGTLSFNFSQGITVEAVANFTNVGAWQRIMDFGNGSASNNILFSRYGSTDNLFFEIYNGASSTFINTSGGIVQNQLCHYVATVNGAMAYVYRNGVLINSGTFATVPTTVSRTNCYIGKSNWADEYFQGQIPITKIYNRALTTQEVRQNYQQYKTRFNLS
jgi:hypothetical protein